MDEAYRVPAQRATARIVEKKSEFIAALSPAESEEAALAFLSEVRAAHRTAAHNVYAYQLLAGARTRYSDDGEPAKTAGLPVLGVLTHAPLTNCIIVVTRYFGGTLLGTGGLVRAYTAAATAAVQAADILTIQRCRRLTLTLAYPQYEAARRLLEQAGAHIDEPLFGAEVQLGALLPAEAAEATIAPLHELLRGEAGIALGEVHYAPF
ncbi:MAG: YigZ family protein [Oscillospiraceae bacterium]